MQKSLIDSLNQMASDVDADTDASIAVLNTQRAALKTQIAANIASISAQMQPATPPAPPAN